MMLRVLLALLCFDINAYSSNRTQELSKINGVCENLQTNLCLNEACPVFCYNKYEKWHHNPEFFTKECLKRCTPTDMCVYTGMPKRDETALDRQLRAQMIMCMKEETGEIDKSELESDNPVNKEKHEWAKFHTPEFQPIYDNGFKILESKKPKDDEEEKKEKEPLKEEYTPDSCSSASSSSKNTKVDPAKKNPEKNADVSETCSVNAKVTAPEKKGIPTQNKNENTDSSTNAPSPQTSNLSSFEVAEHSAKKRKPIDSVQMKS